MRTVLDNGEPCGYDDLLASFAVRIEALSVFADIIGLKAGKHTPLRALSFGVMALRDDWHDFEDALQALPDTELVRDESSLRVLEAAR
jgi:hypothetical protein